MWFYAFVVCVFGGYSEAFEMGGVISGNSMAGVPLGRSLGSGVVDLEGICSGPGFFCLNCTHAVTCVPLPVGYLMMPLQDECPAGQTCNAHEGKCSEQAVPECDVTGYKYRHVCEQVGIFPDAFDCRKFHLCSPPEGFPLERPADHRAAMCPRHYGYNPQSAQCSIPLHRGQCQEKPVPDCTYIGQSEVLSSSPNHYYICIQKNGTLVPQIFICPHGWVYSNGFCGPEQKPDVPDETNNSNKLNRDEPGSKNKVNQNNNEPISDDFNPTDDESPWSQGHFGPNENDKPDFKPDEPGDFNSIEEHLATPDEDESHQVFSNNEETNHDDRDENHERHSEDNSISSSEEKPTTTKIEAFFSTEKTSTYAADTFLADKFDLANYESTDDGPPPVDDFVNSFETEPEWF